MKSLGRISVLVLGCVGVLLAGTAGGRSAERVAPASFAVYLARGVHVAPVRRVAPHASALARASLVALLQGPTATERRSGYSSAIPSGTALRGLSLVRGRLTVDLSRRYQEGGGSLSMQLRVAEVVFTATQFPSVRQVAFRLDGEPVEAIGGEGVVVEPSVGRAAFEVVAPPILIEQPLPGDVVRKPLIVRGSANVFEAQLVVDVRTPGGKLLAHRTVHASAGTGMRGRFSVHIPLESYSGKAIVVAYTHSAKNGAHIHTIRIPVTIGR
jgi:hypothetical protein